MNILSLIGAFVGIGLVVQLVMLGVIFAATALAHVVILKREVKSLRLELLESKGCTQHPAK